MSEEHKKIIRDLVSGPGKTSRWISAHLDYCEPDWCLIYPFRWEQDHYPKYRSGLQTPNYPVHRLMCEYRNGPPPTPGHHSAHSCNRGTDGCVNPMHVAWKTPAENQLDRFRGKPKKPRDKLTWDAAVEIRKSAETELPRKLAQRYGVTVRAIRLVLAGKTWNKPYPDVSHG